MMLGLGDYVALSLVCAHLCAILPFATKLTSARVSASAVLPWCWPGRFEVSCDQREALGS